MMLRHTIGRYMHPPARPPAHRTFLKRNHLRDRPPFNAAFVAINPDPKPCSNLGFQDFDRR